jgi:hypothetical protein
LGILTSCVAGLSFVNQTKVSFREVVKVKRRSCIPLMRAALRGNNHSTAGSAFFPCVIKMENTNIRKLA